MTRSTLHTSASVQSSLWCAYGSLQAPSFAEGARCDVTESRRGTMNLIVAIGLAGVGLEKDRPTGALT